MLTNRQLLGIRDTISSSQFALVTVHIPEKTPCSVFGCGYDVDLGGGKDPACLSCGGTGLETTWRISTVSARVMWVDPAKVRFVRGGAVMTGEVGDCALQVSLADVKVMQACYENQDAYIIADDKTVRPDSITINRVSHTTSYDVRCSLVKGRLDE